MSAYKVLVTAANAARVATFDDDPARDDPHDAVEQELLGIWLSISRLRQIIRRGPAAAASGRIIALQRRTTTKKPARKKPRHRAA